MTAPARVECSIAVLMRALSRILCTRIVIEEDGASQHWLCAHVAAGGGNNNNHIFLEFERLVTRRPATTTANRQLFQRPRLLAPLQQQQGQQQQLNVVYLLLQEDHRNFSNSNFDDDFTSRTTTAIETFESLVDVTPFIITSSTSLEILKQHFSLCSAIFSQQNQQQTNNSSNNNNIPLFCSFIVNSSVHWLQPWNLHDNGLLCANASAWRADHHVVAAQDDPSGAKLQVFVCVDPPSLPENSPLLSLADYADFVFPNLVSEEKQLTALVQWWFARAPQVNNNNSNSSSNRNSTQQQQQPHNPIFGFATSQDAQQHQQQQQFAVSPEQHLADCVARGKFLAEFTESFLKVPGATVATISSAQLHRAKQSRASKTAKRRGRSPDKNTNDGAAVSAAATTTATAPVTGVTTATAATKRLHAVRASDVVRVLGAMQKLNMMNVNIQKPIECNHELAGRIFSVLADQQQQSGNNNSKINGSSEQRHDVGTVTILVASNGQLIPFDAVTACEFVGSIRWAVATPLPFVRTCQHQQEEQFRRQHVQQQQQNIHHIVNTIPVIGLGSAATGGGVASGVAPPSAVRHVTILAVTDNLRALLEHEATSKRFCNLAEGALRDIAARNAASFLPEQQHQRDGASSNSNSNSNSAAATQQQQNSMSLMMSMSSLPMSQATQQQLTQQNQQNPQQQRRMFTTDAAATKKATLSALTPSMINAIGNIIARSDSAVFKRNVCRAVGLLAPPSSPVVVKPPRKINNNNLNDDGDDDADGANFDDGRDGAATAAATTSATRFAMAQQDDEAMILKQLPSDAAVRKALEKHFTG